MAVENPDNDSDNDLKNKNKLRYCDTVDGRNPANQLRLVVYPITDRVS